MTNLVTWFKDNYEKVLAALMGAILLASLLYLAVEAGSVRSKQEGFERELGSWVPDYPKAVSVDPSGYVKLNDQIIKPFQIVEPTNESGLVFAPERRVTCPECHNPIPYDAKVCTYVGCEFVQPSAPEERPSFDSDGDGMPDAWEKNFGFDLSDSKDAALDKDSDGFTNLEECEGKTDPLDLKNHPPYAERLVVESAARDPFKLLFKGASTMPDGSKRFQLNLRGDMKTFFAKLGESVEGFKLIKYDEKIELKDPAKPNGPTTDKSVLTLARGNDQIELQKGVQFNRTEYKIVFRFLIDSSKPAGTANTEFDLKDERYKIKEVKSVDTGAETVVIARLSDGKEFTIGRNIKQDKHASGGEGKDPVEAHGEGKK